MTNGSAHGRVYTFPKSNADVEHFSHSQLQEDEGSIQQMDLPPMHTPPPASPQVPPSVDAMLGRALARRRWIRLQWRATLGATLVLAIVSLFLPWSCIS